MKLGLVCLWAAVLSSAEAPAYAAPAPFQTPDAAVNALYRLPSIPIRPMTMRRFFTRDLAQALIKDSHSDGVGVANDSDYRYDAQDMQITGLHLEDYADGAGTSVIRAHFNNFGKPYVVTYDLCLHGPNDWRISDVTMPEQNLRKVLNLSPVDAMKGCR